jgi:hypothetical protein
MSIMVVSFDFKSSTDDLRDLFLVPWGIYAQSLKQESQTRHGEQDHLGDRKGREGRGSKNNHFLSTQMSVQTTGSFQHKSGQTSNRTSFVSTPSMDGTAKPPQNGICSDGFPVRQRLERCRRRDLIAFIVDSLEKDGHRAIASTSNAPWYRDGFVFRRQDAF